jgi:DNA modification methylase
VQYQNYKSNEEELAVLVADNKIAELSEIDGQVMADVIVELDQVDYPLELTALSDIEIRDYVTGPLEATSQDDTVPETPKVPKTKTGDLYILGEHRFLCGDVTKRRDVTKLMGGDKADLVFTDPPYGISYGGGAGNKKKRQGLIGDESADLYDPCCKEAFTHSTEEAALYLWHAGHKGRAGACANAAMAAGYEIRSQLMWHKLKAHYGGFMAQYMQKHEPCYYCFKKGQTVQWYGATNEVTVWEIEQPMRSEDHPTQKPVLLAERAITNSSTKSQIVLDLFLGSGTTMIAAEKLNRKCYGLEIEPLYCDVAVKRWENFTGKKAKRVRKGK